MKAYLIETMGVFLGMVLPCMGGLLVIPAHMGRIGWTWGYDGAAAAIYEIKWECRRISPGAYRIGNCEIWLERRRQWRVWNVSRDEPLSLDAFTTLTDAIAFARGESC